MFLSDIGSQNIFTFSATLELVLTIEVVRLL